MQTHLFEPIKVAVVRLSSKYNDAGVIVALQVLRPINRF
jgi:hypothetical protein